MTGAEISNLVIAIIAIVVSLFAFVWTLISYYKDRKHEFYSSINDNLKMICFSKLPNTLNLFIDIKSKKITSDKYDDVSEILINTCAIIQPLKYFDIISYNSINTCVIGFDDICIELSSKNTIEDVDILSFQNKINELYKLIRNFCKTH